MQASIMVVYNEYILLSAYYAPGTVLSQMDTKTKKKMNKGTTEHLEVINVKTEVQYIYSKC